MDRLLSENEKLQQAQRAFEAFQAVIGRDGIGRLAEKSMHGVLKFYVDADPSHHEIPLSEGVVADIFDTKTVTEIQTANYSALAKKLSRILDNYAVHVICPIVKDRYLYLLNEESGAFEGGRKSPVHGSRCHALIAMYDLDRFLTHPNFSITFVMLDAAEYKTHFFHKCGRKRTKKLDLVPQRIESTWNVEKREDYLKLLPEGLPETFTAAQFYKETRLRGRKGSIALKFLRDCELIMQIGKQGNAHIYTLNKVIKTQTEVQYE